MSEIIKENTYKNLPVEINEMIKYLTTFLINNDMKNEYIYDEVNSESYFNYFLEYIKGTNFFFDLEIKNFLLNSIIKTFNSNIDIKQFQLYLKDFFDDIKENGYCTCFFYENHVVYRIIDFDYYFFPVDFECKDEKTNNKFKNYLMNNHLELENGMIKFCAEYNSRKKLFDENLIKNVLNIEIKTPFYANKYSFKYENFDKMPEFNIKRCKIQTNNIYEFKLIRNIFIYWILKSKFQNLEKKYNVFIYDDYSVKKFDRYITIYFIEKFNKKTKFVKKLSIITDHIIHKILTEISNSETKI